MKASAKCPECNVCNELLCFRTHCCQPACGKRTRPGRRPRGTLTATGSLPTWRRRPWSTRTGTTWCPSPARGKVCVCVCVCVSECVCQCVRLAYVFFLNHWLLGVCVPIYCCVSVCERIPSACLRAIQLLSFQSLTYSQQTCLQCFAVCCSPRPAIQGEPGCSSREQECRRDSKARDIMVPKSLST